MNLARQ